MDGVAGPGKLTIQARCLSGYYPPVMSYSPGAPARSR